MTEREGTDQRQRYCPNCGTEASPEDAFCRSCGAGLAPGGEGPWRTGSTNAPRRSSLGAALGETIQGLVRRIGRSRVYSSDVPVNVLRDLLRRAKDLPIALKVAGAVVGALLLLTVLSPLALFAALLAFGVSVIALIVRARQRRSKGRWPIVAVASLVLILTFAGISNALYGSESVESTGAGGGANDRGAKEKKDAARKEVQDTKTPENKKRLGSGDPASYDVVVSPSEVSGSRPPTAVMIVAAPAAGRGDLKAVCQAVSKELVKRYPQYEVVSITVQDRAGPDHDSIGIVAYFENEYAKRDYIPGVNGIAYSASCGP